MTVWILYDDVKVFSTKEKAYAYVITHLNYEDYPDRSKEEIIADVLTDKLDEIDIFKEEVI